MLGSGLGKSRIPKSGVNKTATSHDVTRVIPTTQKIPPAYSPEVDLAKPTGRKPATVINVPENMGNAVLVQAKVAASSRLQPCSIFTAIISTAMIASSTSNPSDKIKAPSVMRSRFIPMLCMITSEIAKTKGTLKATTIPVRIPKLRNETISTITNASKNDLRNSPTDASTTCGWKATVLTSTPTGISVWISCHFFLRDSPSSRTLPPFCMTTPKPTAGLPL